ncbi:MAG: CPBP family intramembrane metalloprotease, partial [Pseudorhodoferax sp.]
MPTPFILLLLSIAAACWPLPRGGWPGQVPPWALLYGAAVAMAWHKGWLQPSALAALAALFVLAAAVPRVQNRALVFVSWLALAGLCAALALHRVPGFSNPVLLDGVRWSAGARPFTQHLNFDKGSVGLALLVLLAPATSGDGRRAMGLAAATALATAALVLGLAWWLGMVRPDLKWSLSLALFLPVNLLLTCVAEEALFRLLVQDALAGRFGGRTSAGRTAAAVLLSAALFGLAHLAGGPRMALLAGLTGLGAALAYAWTGRLGAAVGVHFAVNAVHALAFTYPALAGR